MNYELMAADLVEFINNENIFKPVLMGHSMGGKAALVFDKIFPKVLKKLIVNDIGLKSSQCTMIKF